VGVKVTKDYPAPGDKKLFFPCSPTKTAKFECKIRLRKSAEEAKAEHLLFAISGVERSPQPQEANGVFERCNDFTAFFQKIRIFRHILT